MNLAELLKKGLVRKVGADEALSAELMANARNDLLAAQKNLDGGDNGWALAIAYNAMLSAGRALMAQEGYGTMADGYHLVVVQFCSARLGPEASDLTNALNHYRTRRHGVLYGQALAVGENEARSAIEKAGKFVEKVRGKMAGEGGRSKPS